MTSDFSTVKEKFTDRNLWKKAVRLGIQSSVAAAVLFVVMQYFELPEKFVGVLSAVLVVAPGIGGTLSKAKDRFLSTVVGCIVGSVCLLALPGGYGTAVGLAVSMLLMNLLVGFFPDWRYGIVAAVALALGSDGDVWQTAFDRCFAIGLGVVIGTSASLVVWPEKSSTRADHSLQAAIKALIDYFNLTLDSAVENEGGERRGTNP
ncbi:MAG: FUSC family protein [Verrucomicrobiales bacterium]|nr:FUSC family protein [Verrucomicrobiales bacterium]